MTTTDDIAAIDSFDHHPDCDCIECGPSREQTIRIMRLKGWSDEAIAAAFAAERERYERESAAIFELAEGIEQMRRAGMTDDEIDATFEPS